eukprot:jgi/Botrbrau1/2509/Bobra.0079s0001.1
MRTMVIKYHIFCLLLGGFSVKVVLGQACSPGSVRLQTKLILADVLENADDSIRKLSSCLGLSECNLATYEFSQCGAARSTRINGATKAASVVLKPEGCTEVYSCKGTYVDTDVFNAVKNAECIPVATATGDGGVCAGVLLQPDVLNLITCSTCSGWICDGCNDAKVPQGQCQKTNNCNSQLRRRDLLQAADLRCSAAVVTLEATDSAQANAVVQKLSAPSALRTLGACIGHSITSIGPNKIL